MVTSVKNEHQSRMKKIKPTPAPGSDGGKSIYIVGQDPASTPEDNNGDDDPPKRGWKLAPGGSGKGIMSRIKDELSGNKESIEEIRSPLAIDLDGDGVETVSVDNGVYFDHDGNGFAEKTGWISSDDALLVRDINGNGQIDDGSELFGDQTILSNGEKAANGFEALADLDSNHDGIFDGDDEAFGEIKVWQDLNQNGVAEYDELSTLEKAGITSINLDYQNQSITDDNGNKHSQTGNVVNFDQTVSTISDIWFKTKPIDSMDKADIDISDEITALPDIEGFGHVHDLHTAMALDESGDLKALVEQYIAETNPVIRETILLDLIYTWVGVIDIDPESRAATQIYGNVIGDARKLETLEAFWGEGYLGTWCWGAGGKYIAYYAGGL